MHSLCAADVSSTAKVALYARLHEEVKAIANGERDWFANTANCAKILFHSLPDIN
jgi:putative methionine-R-sulfoxide reductase with GAF domain